MSTLANRQLDWALSDVSGLVRHEQISSICDVPGSINGQGYELR